MRQGLFAVLLILAAFSGGALVNGPGLDYLRDQIARGTTSGDGEGDDLDAPTVESAEAIPITVVSEDPTAAPSSAKPAPNQPPLPVAQKSPFALSGASSDEQQAERQGATGLPSVRAPRGPSIANAPTSGEPVENDAPPIIPRGSPASPPSLLDAARSRLSQAAAAQNSDPSAASSAPSPPSPDAGSAADAGVPAAAWSDASDSTAPARPVLPASGPPPETGRDAGVRLVGNPGTPNSPAGLEDWGAVRRRMEELGVGRYWVEGEFGGPVVFRCVVPVVGDRAVSQHFEAEGDDLLAAALDALRRIALWKATGETP